MSGSNATTTQQSDGCGTTNSAASKSLIVDSDNVNRLVSVQQGTAYCTISKPPGLISIDGNLVIELERVFDMPKGSRDGEPHLPIRPEFRTVLGVGLYSDLSRCYDWMEWADARIETLKKSLVDEQIARGDERKHSAGVIDKIFKEQQQNLQTMCTHALSGVRKESEKKMKQASDMLALLDEREQGVKAVENKVEQMGAKSKAFADLCNAVVDMGKKTDKAVRDMSNLASRRNPLKSAYDKWIEKHCGPIFELVALNTRFKQEHDEYDRQHNERLADLQKQNMHLAELVTQKEQELLILEEERQQFLAEQYKWRFQRWHTLSSPEDKMSMGIWLEDQIKELKPILLEEARRCNWESLRSEWDEHKSTAIADATEVGLKEGHNKGIQEGYTKGEKHGYTVGLEEGKHAGRLEFQDDMEDVIEEARSKGWLAGQEEGYTVGEASGYARGMAEGQEQESTEGILKGRDQGYTEGLADGETVGYYKGRSTGHFRGHQRGYEKGRAEGQEAGRKEAREEGYNEGYGKGYEEGYSAGEEEGEKTGRAEEGRKQTEVPAFLLEAIAEEGWENKCKQKYSNGYDDGRKAGFDDGFQWGVRQVPVQPPSLPPPPLPPLQPPLQPPPSYYWPFQVL
jgi:flagellar biosynthesis/type III secretory pathway protein FliH